MPKDNKPLEVKAWTIHDLWAKYEDIAMHFNDLLIRLRTQALAAVAVLSTLVGIFTKTDEKTIHVSWEIATDVFGLLVMFWIAIWAIDRCYYNRLLVGAVIALRDIEAESKKQEPSLAINLSTQIETFVAHPVYPSDDRSRWQKFQSKLGVRVFYLIVLAALILGGLFCYSHQAQAAESTMIDLSCDGTHKLSGMANEQPVKKIGLSVNFAQQTVSGFFGEVAHIDKADAVNIEFSAQLPTSGATTNIAGGIDRVTGAAWVRTMLIAQGFNILSRDNYELTCSVTRRLF